MVKLHFNRIRNDEVILKQNLAQTNMGIWLKLDPEPVNFIVVKTVFLFQ